MTTIAITGASPDEFRRVLESRGVPPAGVGMAVALGDAIRAGEFDDSSSDLETLLGRPPMAPDAFLARARQ